MERLIRFPLPGIIMIVLRRKRFLMPFLLCFMLIGCSEPKPIPADKEMTDNFVNHEDAFNEIKDSILTLRAGYYYPPFDRETDYEYESRCDSSISAKKQYRLDSLLHVIGCERVYYKDRENYKGEKNDSSLTFIYWVRGLSIGGTWKYYVYIPDFWGLHDMTRYEIIKDKEMESVLNETGYADTIMYKHIKDSWYIELGHDN